MPWRCLQVELVGGASYEAKKTVLLKSLRCQNLCICREIALQVDDRALRQRQASIVLTQCLLYNAQVSMVYTKSR